LSSLFICISAGNRMTSSAINNIVLNM